MGNNAFAQASVSAKSLAFSAVLASAAIKLK